MAKAKNEEWKETIIKTDVDRLLKYLTEKGSVNIQRISKDLGIPESTIKMWTKALASSNLIEKEYSTRGVILKVGDKTKSETQKKIKELHRSIIKRIKDVRLRIRGESHTIKEVKKELEKLGILLEKDRKESSFLEKRIHSLKDEQAKLREELLEDIKKERGIEKEISSVLGNIEEVLAGLKETEDLLRMFTEAKNEIDKNLIALKNLKEYEKNIDKMKSKAKEIEKEEKKASILFQKSMKSLKRIFKGKK